MSAPAAADSRKAEADRRKPTAGGRAPRVTRRSGAASRSPAASGQPAAVAQSPATRARAAFTLTELLVVATVIAILLAILLPVVGLLRNRGRTASTRHQFEQIATAIDTYLGQHAVLGEHAADGTSRFPAEPLRYLATAGYPGQGRLLVDTGGSGTGPFAAPTPGTDSDPARKATHPTDAWGEAILFEVRNAPIEKTTDRFHTVRIALRSSAGTADPRDDLLYVHDPATSGWQPRTLLGVDGEGKWELGP